ncbi:26S proteasome complex subunit DSS1 [Orchesella cincta]|uniref:26S proteasome complex subunit SEM1 n=1 Tax=Orchesella cincta TaxID=48709 RepID=A0A1D2N957_ORCCI|nr:26S proteasome complex subunit DSS1 [Orchesella cincta]
MAGSPADIKTESKPEVEKLDLGDLEEDDDFEEFPADNIGAVKSEEEEDVKVWEDNWDDDNIEDDFSSQLKKELEIQGFIGGQGNPAKLKK